MARPKGIRDDQIIQVIADPTYKNQAAQAKALGVTEAALSYHLNRKPELGEAAQAIRLKLVASRLGPVYRALLNKATGESNKGDVPAANTLLKAAGDLVERRQEEHSGEVTYNINIATRKKK
jgi:hypothetical protein